MTDDDSAAAVRQPSPATLRRRGGLLAWGVFLIVIGTVCSLILLATLLINLLAVEQLLGSPPERLGARPSQSNTYIATADNLPGIGIALLVSITVVATGVGACMGRRWTRPIVLVICGFTMAYALFSLIGITLSLPHQLDLLDDAQQRGVTAAMRTTPAMLILLFCIRGALLLGGAVILPWFLYRFFASPATVQALDELDSELTWTDRCPVAVLGWSTFCLMGSLGALMQLQHPVVPAFIVAFRGGVATIILSVGAIVLVWGAWLCYRLDRLGWVLTSLFVFAVHLGIVLYFFTGGAPADLRSDPATRVMNRRLMPVTDSSPSWFALTMAILETLLVLGFSVYVAGYFLDIHWRVTALWEAKPSNDSPIKNAIRQHWTR